MKQLKLYMTLALFAVCLAVLPQKTAAFAELPVAVVVLDQSGNVSEQLVSVLETKVKRRFRFPYYQLVPQSVIREALTGNLPAPDKNPPYMKQPQLKDIAAAIPAELVVAVWVDDLREEVYHTYNFGRGETFQWVYVNIYVTAYRKTDNKYFSGRIRRNETNSLAISTPAYKVAEDGMTDAVNKMREVFPVPAPGA